MSHFPGRIPRSAPFGSGGDGHRRNNRNVPNGAKDPTATERTYAAAHHHEPAPLIDAYEHLTALPNPAAALTLLRRAGSLVKPLMRKRGWRVRTLAEFLPKEENLLGLNINQGEKICLRLRFHRHPELLLPTEQVVDTLLHELAHILVGPHDGRFYALWEELRAELEVLMRKGYTGEGFLSAGQRLGGNGVAPPPHELRRLARAGAEKRKAQNALAAGSGRRLGGTPIHLYGGDVRRIIADQATARRNEIIDRGCASGREDAGALAAQAAEEETVRTGAEEDEANDRAIAQALYELLEVEEAEKLRASDEQVTFSSSAAAAAAAAAAASMGSSASMGLAWDADNGLYDMRAPPDSGAQPSYDEQMRWAMQESLSGAPAFSPPPVPLHSKPGDDSPQSDQRQFSSPEEPRNTSLPSKRKLLASPPATPPSTGKVSNNPPNGLTTDARTNSVLPATEQWPCPTCTLINPLQFLACGACGSERSLEATRRPEADSTVTRTAPKKAAAANARLSRGNVKLKRTAASVNDIPLPPAKEGLGWNCARCGSFMEHAWWTCSACGMMKGSS